MLIYSLKWYVLGRERAAPMVSPLLLFLTIQWFPPSHTLSVHMFNMPGPHTQPPTVCSSSGGCTERDLDQAGQRQGEWDRFDECGQKSPEQRGEVREGLVRAASNLHLSDYGKLPLACLSSGRTSSLYRKPSGAYPAGLPQLTLVT